MYDGHLLESETYVGGHVEALKAGVYRSDIPNDFKLDPSTAQQLIDDLDAALKFSIEVEGNLKMEDVLNYEEVSYCTGSKCFNVVTYRVDQESNILPLGIFDH
jgi:DNA polymerase epsilon subunit 1